MTQPRRRIRHTTPLVRTCARCDEPFTVQYPCRSQRFCGLSCSAKSRRAARNECGTIGGYRQHLRDRTVPCDPCNLAATTDQRARNIRGGRTKALYIPIADLANLVRVPEARDILARILASSIVDALDDHTTETADA